MEGPCEYIKVVLVKYACHSGKRREMGKVR
jgi:hypothetical protein